MIKIWRDQETETFVSYDSILDLYSAGRTCEEAFRAIQSAVQLYTRVCHERGILLPEPHGVEAH